MDARRTAVAALVAGRNTCLYRQVAADTETPVSAWFKLGEKGRGDFLLESVEGERTRSRYSVIGLDPDLVFRARDGRADIARDWRGRPDVFEPDARPALDVLRGLVRSIRMEVPDALPPVLPFLVGYFGYETVRLVERLPVPDNDPLGVPDMLFVRAGLLLVFDRLTDILTIVAPLYAREGMDAEAAVAGADARLDATVVRLAGSLPDSAREVHDAPVPTGDPEHAVLPERYLQMVERARDYIMAGDILQVVLAQRFSLPFPLPPFELYRALRRINPSPFLYCLDLPGFVIVGSSPEILVRARDGKVTIRPIAGTRRRGATRAEDLANEQDLLADPKERAEHLMLLDLGRNDVARVAEPGTVRVTEKFTIERYSHVMHLVSNVEGVQRADTDAIDALFAGLPAGTVSGAPKVRAMEIIAELESEKRGPYSGGIGYFAPDGSMDSCIVLRTAVVKDGVMHVTAGAGIVLDSNPEAELRECEAKAGALFAAAKAALAHRFGA